MSLARLVISCPDRPRIVAAVSAAISDHGGNIIQSDQYSTDPEGGRFFMRVEFSVADAGAGARARFEASFAPVAERFDMRWRLTYASERKRVAVMSSTADHCLMDLLWRWRRGELECEIALVISNHERMRAEVDAFGVRYVHVPVTAAAKNAAEEAQLELLAEGFDLVVLARYMQILSAGFLARVGVPIINIHHSFLPAFAGADPYAQARERGVKLIGATAHYVTEELDAGPIIEQDTARVSHRDSAERLAHIGRDIERVVLARAVRWHLEDRVIINRNATVVFA
ncbi:MAG: formyltetrahydrofolate deformylase [Solirubrobacteraceae bacterium]